MPRRTSPPILTWSADTELVAIALTLQPQSDFQAPSHFSTELHSWFLNQVRLTDPELSAYLHDGQSEKAFIISALTGDPIADPQASRTLHFSIAHTYSWTIAALSKPVCDWLQHWLTQPPTTMKLRSGSFHIQAWDIALLATTYEHIWDAAEVQDPETFRVQSSDLTLSFRSPTSFRKRSNHMPLPIPENVFQSYLRRWNNFAHLEVEQDDFLHWVNECVVILRHEVRSQKVQAGKQGSVTGFIGSVQFGLTPKAKDEPEYIQLIYALVACAPYFGTGHKVTFGLGQTAIGWQSPPNRTTPVELPPAPIRAPRHSEEPAPPAPAAPQPSLLEQHITQRHGELKDIFLRSKKRQGGERAIKTADLWATIVSRQETGEKLSAIAADLNLPYDTVKKYAQKARAALE